VTSPYARPAEQSRPHPTLVECLPPSRLWKTVALLSLCAALAAFLLRMGYTAWMTPMWLFYIVPVLSLCGIVGGTATLVVIIRRDALAHWTRMLGLPLANIAIGAFAFSICLSVWSFSKILVYSLWIPFVTLLLSVSCAYCLSVQINQPKTGRPWAIAAVGIGFFQFVVYIIDRFFAGYGG